MKQIRAADTALGARCYKEEERNPVLNLLPLSLLSEHIYLQSCLRAGSAAHCLSSALRSHIGKRKQWAKTIPNA